MNLIKCMPGHTKFLLFCHLSLLIHIKLIVQLKDFYSAQIRQAKQGSSLISQELRLLLLIRSLCNS